MTTTETSRPTTDVLGIVQATIPVSDLARSSAWYRDLLGLEYVREFVGDGQVTGNALADWDAGFFIALRLRSTTAGAADLRGEHPVVIEAAGPDAAERIRARAAAHGIRSASGVHADASWTEYLDPDGIAVRVVHTLTGPARLHGRGVPRRRGAAVLRPPAPRAHARVTGRRPRRRRSRDKTVSRQAGPPPCGAPDRSLHG